MNNNPKPNKSNKLNVVFAIFILVAISLGCNFSCGNFVPDKPENAPTTEQQNALVKQTLKDFAKGLESGDFSTLRSNASSEFQSAVSLEQAKTAFKPMMDKKDVFVPVMQAADSKAPQFDTPPAIKEEGNNYTMKYEGSFPTEKLKLIFDFRYIWRDSQWKLMSLDIRFKPE